jgi:hypothetical protein
MLIRLIFLLCFLVCSMANEVFSNTTTTYMLNSSEIVNSMEAGCQFAADLVFNLTQYMHNSIPHSVPLPPRQLRANIPDIEPNASPLGSVLLLPNGERMLYYIRSM